MTKGIKKYCSSGNSVLNESSAKVIVVKFVAIFIFALLMKDFLVTFSAIKVKQEILLSEHLRSSNDCWYLN